jgi:hypothetical protein
VFFEQVELPNSTNPEDMKIEYVGIPGLAKYIVLDRVGRTGLNIYLVASNGQITNEPAPLDTMVQSADVGYLSGPDVIVLVVGANALSSANDGVVSVFERNTSLIGEWEKVATLTPAASTAMRSDFGRSIKLIQDRIYVIQGLTLNVFSSDATLQPIQIPSVPHTMGIHAGLVTFVASGYLRTYNFINGAHELVEAISPPDSTFISSASMDDTTLALQVASVDQTTLGTIPNSTIIYRNSFVLPASADAFACTDQSIYTEELPITAAGNAVAALIIVPGFLQLALTQLNADATMSSNAGTLLSFPLDTQLGGGLGWFSIDSTSSPDGPAMVVGAGDPSRKVILMPRER